MKTVWKRHNRINNPASPNHQISNQRTIHMRRRRRRRRRRRMQ
jgi:hypothetical protein